jgi:pimeloyl-ACP methyl ester carboxylesterase
MQVAGHGVHALVATRIVHGERLTPAELVAMAEDLLACTVREDLLSTDEKLTPLDPPPCPITLAWSERDRVLPLDVNGRHARTLIPGAEWRVLPGVGHVPMIDNPALVAETILERTQAHESLS